MTKGEPQNEIRIICFSVKENYNLDQYLDNT